MKRLLLVIFSLYLVIMFSGFALAKSNPKKYIIETEYHHLGDDEGFNWMFNPDAEGTFWEKSFYLPKSIKTKSCAFLMFAGNHIDWSAIIVNNRRIDIVPNRDAEYYYYSEYLISLPQAFFYRGENTIRFEVFQWDNGNYDDMEFGELELWFQ